MRSGSSDWPIHRQEAGFGLIEVMVAMMITVCALLGSMTMFQWADLGLGEALQASRALAMIQSRVDAKRTNPWSALLTDDLNADGVFEVVMKDDGTPPDDRAGDGVYTAGVEQNGIALVWTVEPTRSASLARVGAVIIMARAGYRTARGLHRELQVGTLRANPGYVGPQ